MHDVRRPFERGSRLKRASENTPSVVRKLDDDFQLVVKHREVMAGHVRPRSDVGRAGARREGAERPTPTPREAQCGSLGG